MKTGSRSLVFGIHQFLYHPITVAMAWRDLYGSWPNWREAVCIFIHDWGYWGCKRMSDDGSRRHPEFGARLAGRMFGPDYHDLVLLHSRHLAKDLGREPSRLCWPDKLSVIYYPTWLYWALSGITGEINDYLPDAENYLQRKLTRWDFAVWIKSYFKGVAMERMKAERKHFCRKFWTGVNAPL